MSDLYEFLALYQPSVWKTPFHGASFASIGSNKPYSAIHMFGGETGRGHATKIPARPYLPFNPQTSDLTEPAKETILEVLDIYIQRLL